MPFLLPSVEAREAEIASRVYECKVSPGPVITSHADDDAEYEHDSWLVSANCSDSNTEFLDEMLVGDDELLLDTATRFSSSVARRDE